MKLKLYFIFLLFLTIPDVSFSQAIREMENLVSITFHEITTSSFSYTFDKESDELNAQLPIPLSDNNNDFQGWVGQEFFDVFYSDEDGTFNNEGAFVTIEARFDNSGSGGGCNIAAVEFNFDNGESIFANQLVSFFANGSNYNPLSELNAIDCDLNTWSTLGETGNSSDYLRLTIGIQDIFSVISYTGCLDDGYSIAVNGNIYNQNNTTGTEILTSYNGCDSMVSIQLIFENCENYLPCDIYIPNAFSPNQDGYNDYFTIYLSENCQLQDFKIRIFNRWGAEVFYSEEVDFQWNGRFKNQLLDTGVFVWYIEYIIPSEGVKRLKGDFTLVK